MTRADAYALIDAERLRQADRWGGNHPWGAGDCSSDQVEPIVKVGVLSEECGEVARAVLDGNVVALRSNLDQVAAVAVAWLESVDSAM